MAREDLPERVAAIAALADPIRRDLYLYVSAQPAPVSRDQASEALRIARHTAKFHLDTLAEEGLLDTDFKRLSERRGPGAGRPTKLYQRSSRQLSVTLPERRYDSPPSCLPAQSTPQSRTAAPSERGSRQPGPDYRRPGPDRCRPSTKPRTACHPTRRALTEYGYEPHFVGGMIMLGNCPFDMLARNTHNSFVAMNRTMLVAVTDRVSKAGLAARFEPAPDRCCVVLDAD